MTGFIKVASAIPAVTIADTTSNVAAICRLCDEMDKKGVELAVFPELCITGYTCADLFHNDLLLEAALKGLVELIQVSEKWNLAFVVGLPVTSNGSVYNVAAVIRQGKLFGLVPKTYIPNYNEFYEKRWWAPAPSHDVEIRVSADISTTMSTNKLFSIDGVKFGIEICEDLWTTIPPSSRLALAGAEIILNLSASDVLTGKRDYLKSLVSSQSARNICAYVYASAGFGESSTDLVFDGTALIAENGKLLKEGDRWQNDPFFISTDIDISALRHDRITMSSFNDCACKNLTSNCEVVNLGRFDSKCELERTIEPLPFVPATRSDVATRCDEIINIQSAGLAQRLNATKTKNVVIGISGGLDSTLALLVAVKTFDRLGLDRKGIHAITMPGFGTTSRTLNNAIGLIKELRTSFRQISIVSAVNQHFADIGHNPETKDVTYENSQARQRTLLLMDIANQVGGMVVGTGDLSELALGWATYNGDHMSMYGVNTGVPKTLVKYLVSRFADGDACLIDIPSDSKIREILHDIVDTPISPELIPADEKGNITQVTEDLVGPYELHDFFLYYMLRYALAPREIFERAKIAFNQKYDATTILRWLRNFYRRFFSQQFKRSCLPDGPKVGSVCLSPRGDWRMPSDASSALWLRQIDELESELSLH